MKTFVRWIIICIAIWAALLLVPGIYVVGTDAWIAVIVMGFVLGLINVLIKPAAKMVSGCLIVLTLGLFCLVINAGLLYLASWICHTYLNIGFFIDGFWPALFGGIVISIVTVILDAICGVTRAH